MHDAITSSRSGAAPFRQQLGLALAGAPPGSVDRLAELARADAIARGQMLYRQGDPARLTFVVDGHAVFRRTTVDGREFVVGIAGPGSILGLAAIGEQAATSDVVAVSPLDTRYWMARDVRRLLLADGALGLAIVDALGSSAVRSASRFDTFVYRDSRRRVLRVLAEYGDLFIGDAPVLSRQLLPSLVGTSREMTGRVVRALEREGIVQRVGPHGLAVLEPGVLNDALDP